MKSIVFLGGGRITSALVAGLRRAGYKASIVVHDRNPHKLQSLKSQFKVKIEPNLARAVAQARLLTIAVRPADVPNLLVETRLAASPAAARTNRKGKPPDVARRSTIACSLAAGIPLANLRAALPAPFRWARAMPSPTCRFGRGMTALAFDRRLPSSARKEIVEFFSTVGPVLEIPERQFDAFTATYSCSHGYHAVAALARAGEKAGLDRRTAQAAAAHALADGILAWREGDLSLEGLLEEAATPGGIAAAVMNTMNQHGYPKIVERGVRAGVARARQNARKP
jgi:pyrroline-5-carboxylate reductase